MDNNMRWIFALLVLYSGHAFAFDAFKIKDIHIEGLQRTSPGTVFNYLPLEVGDTIDTYKAGDAIKTLFATGFFNDVRLERNDDILIIFVAERPSIDEIEIKGNKDIEKEQLLTALKDIGLSKGRVFNRSVLDKIEQELNRQYNSGGKYGVKIKSTVKQLKRNRVSVDIDIEEGEAATIKNINIVGNKVFNESELLDELQLKNPGLFGNDQYSKQKLSADLESIRSYYQNRGYIHFKIESTQVSISPNKQDIYVTINITEGEQYRVKEVKISGELVIPKEKLFPLIKIHPGAIFSRKKATISTKNLTDKLGDNGYAFANINTIPKANEKTKEVSITFSIDPGHRVYVRRINMFGNTKTRDEVLRRELRQMESAWISTSKVERSKTRLERLGFFENITLETPPVVGVPDIVDINFNVEERPSGNLMAGVGFSQSQGLLFNASVTQDNFLGSGKKISFNFNNSKVNTVYQFAFTNPYYTIDGVSRGFRFSFTETDAAEANITNYSTNVLSAGVFYSFPISEFNRFLLSFDFENVELNTGFDASSEIKDFIAKTGNKFDTIKISGGWSHDTRNRALFASKGNFQRISTEIALPGGDLNFYKLSYKYVEYIPLSKKLTFKFNGEIGYGASYGDTDALPIFEHYFIGGSKSIRGYDDNTLGPRDSRNDPLGGNVRYLGNLEILFPIPFAKDSKSVRISAFIDGGNVFKKDTNFSEFRYSTGIAIKWFSPVGALMFSLARPINDKPGDEIQAFQFTFGSAI